MISCSMCDILHIVTALLLLTSRGGCDVTVALPTAEYYRLTGTWKLGKVKLLDDGVTTKEHVSVPECVHTVTMEWFSSYRDSDDLQYTVASVHSSEPEVLPVVQTSLSWWGMVPISSDLVSLEFRCNGSGVARADVTIAVSNRSHHGNHLDIATYHVFSLTKRCGDCHNNGGIPGRSCDHLQCVNNGQCVDYNGTQVCVCPTGYHGKHCELAWCYPQCLNGGYCVKPNKCLCRKGYDGNMCQKANCEPACQNGGRCVKVGVCHCRPPYHGGRCEERGHIEFIHKPQRNVCVEPLRIVVLACDVMATPVAKITWLKNGKKIPKADHHYLMLHNHTNHITSSVLIIYDITSDDNGLYTCMALSSAVSRRMRSHVTVSPCDDNFSGNYIDGDTDDTEDDDDDDDSDNDFN